MYVSIICKSYYIDITQFIGFGSFEVSVHEGWFIHKSRALRGQLYSEGEPFMVNGLVARRPLL